MATTWVDDFLTDDPVDWELVVVNRQQPDALLDLLGDVFPDRTVNISEADHSVAAEDTVVLIQDDAVVATSPLSALQDSLLLVNSDLYKTGSVGLGEIDPPEVITALKETPFIVRDYPASNKEKLPLILMSRYIEQLAWEAEAGTLRSAFQQLSRIGDEQGTHEAYTNIARTDVAVHVYGRPDWLPPQNMPITIHGARRPVYALTWFVVYTGPGESAALVAEQCDPGIYEGMWTFEDERVDQIETRIVAEMA